MQPLHYKCFSLTKNSLIFQIVCNIYWYNHVRYIAKLTSAKNEIRFRIRKLYTQQDLLLLYPTVHHWNTTLKFYHQRNLEIRYYRRKRSSDNSDQFHFCLARHFRKTHRTNTAHSQETYLNSLRTTSYGDCLCFEMIFVR